MDAFWETLNIPIQVEDDGFQFVNPVVMAQRFVHAMGQAALLGSQIETLTEQIANLTVNRDRKVRELRKLRREVLANAYTKLTKSAPSEIQEAFVLKAAAEQGRQDEFTALEAEIEYLERELESRTPRIGVYKARLKTLELAMNWGKQYLDFDKLITRASLER